MRNIIYALRVIQNSVGILVAWAWISVEKRKIIGVREMVGNVREAMWRTYAL